MGLRMRKSFTVCKGVRVNVGKTGLSTSFGTNGLRYTINSKGRRTTTFGIPGSGLSYSTSSGGRRSYNSDAYARRQEIQHQKQIQKENELQHNKIMVEEFDNLIEIIKGLHKEWGMLLKDMQQIHKKEDEIIEARALINARMGSLFEEIRKRKGE